MEYLIIPIAALIVIWFAFDHYYGNLLLKKQQEMIETLFAKIEQDQKDNNMMHVYCLSEILKRSIENEDYEQAKKATELLNKIKQTT